MCVVCWLTCNIIQAYLQRKAEFKTKQGVVSRFVLARNTDLVCCYVIILTYLVRNMLNINNRTDNTTLVVVFQLILNTCNNVALS